MASSDDSGDPLKILESILADAKAKSNKTSVSFYPAIPLAKGMLAERGQDLTVAAANGKLTPVFAREKEIQQVIEILRRRTKRNPVLVGEAGVGKTAIVEGIAQMIIDRKAPPWLQSKKIISISIFDIIAQESNYAFAEYANRLKEVIDELRTHSSDEEAGSGRIGFFDEIHVLKEFLHGANYLKQYLARGEIQIIGATTIDEYRRYIERDPALERRFAPVFISEPSIETTTKILFNLRPFLERYYGNVRVTDSAIRLAVELADRFVHDRHQPDKSIELIERTCSRVLALGDLSPDGKTLPEGDRRVSSESLLSQGYLQVEMQHVREIASEWTGVPDTTLGSEREKLLRLEDNLKKHICGQDSSVARVAKTIITHRIGTSLGPERPNGVFLFVGPTGVGKTELAKAITLELTGLSDHLIVLDMTGYRESYTVASLVGVAKANIDTPEIPTLTKLVRDHPHGVLLLDEIEKAHPEIWSLFLPVFEEGRLVDRQGSTLHFGDMIIIMTANIDAGNRAEKAYMGEKKRQGLKADSRRLYESIYEREVLNMLGSGEKFPKEFMNRVDQIIVFKPLQRNNIEQILKHQIHELERQLALQIHLTPEAVEFLISKSSYKIYGAREIRRSIDNYVGANLAEIRLALDPESWSRINFIQIDTSAKRDDLVAVPIT